MRHLPLEVISMKILTLVVMMKACQNHQKQLYHSCCHDSKHLLLLEHASSQFTPAVLYLPNDASNIINTLS